MAEKILGKMKEVQFYKWRYRLESMLHADSKAKLEEKNLALLAKELEITQLRVALYRGKVSVAQSLSKEEKEAYHKTREEIENTLGFSLKDSVVDEITFEVKQLEEG